jgi:hypothetical protein
MADPHILAIDPARRLGWARWHPGMIAPESGTIDFMARPERKCFSLYGTWLFEQFTLGIERVVYEQPFISRDPRQAGNNAQLLYGLWGITEFLCDRRRKPLHVITVGMWRSHFHGYVNAPKVIDGEVASKAKRSKWLKARACDACDRRGWPYYSDDEAEALGILDYEICYCNPELHVREPQLDLGVPA